MTTQQFKYHVLKTQFQTTTVDSLIKAINFNREFRDWCQWLDDMAAEYHWNEEDQAWADYTSSREEDCMPF